MGGGWSHFFRFASPTKPYEYSNNVSSLDRNGSGAMVRQRHHRYPCLPLISGMLVVFGVLGWVSQGETSEDRKRPISITESEQPSPALERKEPTALPETPAAASEEQRLALRNAVDNPRWLLFKTDGFDPLERQPNFPDIGPYDLTAAAYPPGGKRYYVVQFTGPIQPRWFEHLRQTGAEALGYLPNNAYLVRIDEAQRARLDGLPNLRWVGDFDPGYKIDPALAQVIKTQSRTREALLRISTFRGTSAEPLRPRVQAVDPSVSIRHLSDTVQGKGRIIFSVRATALGKLIAALARDPDVEWIEEYHPPQLFNDNSIWVIQSGSAASEATPIWDRGITGFGQIYAAADSGLDTDACQMRFSALASAQTFFNTTQPPSVNVTNPGNKIRAYYLVGAAQAYDDTATGFHGTHTTGNAVGDNFATLATATNPAHDVGDGMAPAATVIFQDVGQHDGSLDGLAVGQTDLQQQAHDSGARIHNDSYGIPAASAGDQNTYDLDSQDLDEVMWRLRHYTIFFSAGNDGASPGGLGGGGSTAKNTLSVGATVNGSQGAEDLAFFSSHGPTSDGRFKPDLMAPGDTINSATENAPVGGQSQTDPPNNNCATSTASGTSFSSPTLAGAGLLVRQYFTDGFYPSGVKTPADAFDPSNAVVKAVLINSGQNLTGQFTASHGTGGASGSLPNFGQGWGRVTLEDSLFFPGDLSELKVLNDVLNGATTVVPPAVTTAIQTGQVHEFTLVGVSTIEPLRITLNWSDPSGLTGSGVTLVNNLDLEVLDPNGVLYRGNVNFANAFSSPAGATPADTLNTTENVYIKDPLPGTYTIRVRGTNVPGNGTTTPFDSNRQGYAVLATGNFSFGSGPLVRFGSVGITGGKSDDAFLDRTEALEVSITVKNHGATDALNAVVSLSVDPDSEVPASAVVISPGSITYGTVASKSTATQTFSIALLNDEIDHSNQQLLIKVKAGASGVPITTEVFGIETMANTQTTALFNGFESGLVGWTLQSGTGPNPGPGLVTCETSDGTRPTPLTELKFGKLDCTSQYRNNQNQRATSPAFTVPLTNNTKLVSLNFWHRVGTEKFFDFAQVFLDHNDDGTFNFVVDFNGPDTSQMSRFRADLGSFFNTGRTENIRVLFRLLTDVFVTEFPGWFVDDVSITTKSADPVAATIPTLIAASPSTGAQGTANLDVAITGLNTTFVNGVSAVSFSGSGITVNSTTAIRSTQLTVNITIDPGAALGARTITVTTGSEVASRSVLLRVGLSALSVHVTPSAWNLGTVTTGSIITTWTSATPAGGGFFTALNNGQLTEDLTIRVSGSASWTPGGIPGANVFALGWGQTLLQGTEPAFTPITTAGAPLAENLAVSGSFNFDLKFQAPTSTSAFSEQQIITTIEAELP